MKIERIHADSIPALTERQRKLKGDTLTEEAIQFDHNGRNPGGGQTYQRKQPKADQSMAEGESSQIEGDSENPLSTLHIVA
jgi:hypothetical protein